MGTPVGCLGTCIQCTFNLPVKVPMPMVVLPVNRVMVSKRPMANIMDNKPIVNIPPFGTCIAPANPTVIAATAAALGVPAPGACIPVTPAPWTPSNPAVLVGKMPTQGMPSMLTCMYGGLITTMIPGQVQVIA